MSVNTGNASNSLTINKSPIGGTRDINDSHLRSEPNYILKSVRHFSQES